jgi:predicted acyl esterase
MVANASDRVVGSGVAGPLGAFIARSLPPGPGYTFRAASGSKVLGTRPFAVLAGNDPPPASFYSHQTMHAGLNYITMRDGVELAATVRLPPGKTLADGPFPTVIEDSGYAIAAPHSLIDAVLHTNGESLSDPLVPSTATAVGSVVAPLIGFATVSLQMRGTGCSGGAFGLFDLPTTYDGYDAVQIVGSQPWVKRHKVGLVGISFSGISQMFVAGTRPPDLAAIAPMSLTNDLYATGFPGGIFNSGFAGSWLAQRISDAQAAPAGGQAWAKAMIAQGDTHCLANQAMHPEARNLTSLLRQASHRDPALYDKRAPATWAKKVDVPVFLSGAFQDEQTGGQWPAIIPALAKDPNVWATIVNGTHVDSLGPGTISRWVEFLDIFVAGEVPTAPADLPALADALYQQLAGAPSGTVAPLRFTTASSVSSARAQFIRNTPRVRILLDNGSGSAGPGAMQPVWEIDAPAWPPPKAVATTWFAGTGGTLVRAKPAASTVSFRPNPSARPATDLPTGSAWAALPPYDWTPVTGSNGVGFISPPLTHDVVVAGPASMNLELTSSAADTDLQVTVSEVRPDGKELFINSGVLRASDRALDPKLSTPIDPVPTYLASTASPLPAGKVTEVRVPILPFAYAFRAGSRIRVTVSAPGGDRPAWAFDTPATGGKVVDTLSLGGVRPTSLVMAVLPGVVPPDPQPACPSLRGQPCRTYVAAGNGG